MPVAEEKEAFAEEEKEEEGGPWEKEGARAGGGVCAGKGGLPWGGGEEAAAHLLLGQILGDGFPRRRDDFHQLPALLEEPRLPGGVFRRGGLAGQGGPGRRRGLAAGDLEDLGASFQGLFQEFPQGGEEGLGDGEIRGRPMEAEGEEEALPLAQGTAHQGGGALQGGEEHLGVLVGDLGMEGTPDGEDVEVGGVLGREEPGQGGAVGNLPQASLAGALSLVSPRGARPAA